MDFLNSFIDDGTDWWDCATHTSSKKSNKEILISLKRDIFSQYLLYERVISLHRDNPNIPSFINDDKKKLLLDYYNKLTKITKHAKRHFWLNDVCTCHGLLPSHSA